MSALPKCKGNTERAELLKLLQHYSERILRKFLLFSGDIAYAPWIMISPKCSIDDLRAQLIDNQSQVSPGHPLSVHSLQNNELEQQLVDDIICASRTLNYVHMLLVAFKEWVLTKDLMLHLLASAANILLYKQNFCVSFKF